MRAACQAWVAGMCDSGAGEGMGRLTGTWAVAWDEHKRYMGMLKQGSLAAGHLGCRLVHQDHGMLQD